MTTTESRHSTLPRVENDVLGLADAPPAGDRTSWQAIAAVYASVPMAVVGFLWLYREGHIGETPLWVMIVILAITSVVNAIAFLWLRRHPGPGIQMQVRLAVSAASTAAVVYAVGWGSMFVVGFAVGIAEIVRSNGSATWRGALGWNGAAILCGELAIQLHIAPSTLPLAIAHEVALLGYCCLVLVTRVLVVTSGTAEEAEMKLRERSHHFESLVAHATDVIGVVDEAGVVRFVSPAVETLLGYEPTELRGTLLADVIDPEDVESVRDLLDELQVHPGTMVLRDVRFQNRNGPERRVVMTFTTRDAAGARTVVINLHDVTVERALEERLRFDAMHDALTGTWNRAAFAEAIEMACSASARDGGTVAMLFVDIDHFKFVNDTHGHDQGDQLLIHVARSIQTCLRGSDILGRWGGDEFVVLLSRVDDADEAVVVADRILAELDASPALRPGGNRATVSIGIATSVNGADSATTLARRADEAMYEAKRGGRGRWALSPFGTAGESGPSSPSAAAI